MPFPARLSSINPCLVFHFASIPNQNFDTTNQLFSGRAEFFSDLISCSNLRKLIDCPNSKFLKFLHGFSKRYAKY